MDEKALGLPQDTSNSAEDIAWDAYCILPTAVDIRTQRLRQTAINRLYLHDLACIIARGPRPRRASKSKDLACMACSSKRNKSSCRHLEKTFPPEVAGTGGGGRPTHGKDGRGRRGRRRGAESGAFRRLRFERSRLTRRGNHRPRERKMVDFHPILRYIMRVAKCKQFHSRCILLAESSGRVFLSYFTNLPELLGYLPWVDHNSHQFTSM